MTKKETAEWNLILWVYGEELHHVGNKLGAAFHFAKQLKSMVPPENREAHSLVNGVIRDVDEARTVFSKLLGALEEASGYAEHHQLASLASFDLVAQLNQLVEKVPNTITVTTNYWVDSFEVFGYQKLIQKVFRILFGSVVMAMNGRGSLTVAARRSRFLIEVEIGGSAPGIVSDVAQERFELGLPWAASFLATVGGRLEMETEAGKGLTFKVSFPSHFKPGSLPSPTRTV